MEDSLRVRTTRDSHAVYSAAIRICYTSPGWKTIATWLDGISTTAAPIRAANCRSASGGSAWSLAVTRCQDGSVFLLQAGFELAQEGEITFGMPVCHGPLLRPWSTAFRKVSAT